MGVYRIRVKASNFVSYNFPANQPKVMTFRYDILAYSPKDAISKLPKCHYTDGAWYPEWEVESTYKRTDATPQWSITGVDSQSDVCLRKCSRGKYTPSVI